MAACDPDVAGKSIAPNLSVDQRLSFLKAEQEFIEEVLEDADDCRWVYQALLGCSSIQLKLQGALSSETRHNINTWLTKLKELDPMRTGRWDDLEKKLLLSSESTDT